MPTTRKLDTDLGLHLAIGSIAQKAIGIDDISQVPNLSDCRMEIKLDGHRVLVHRDRRVAHLYSARGSDKSARVPLIVDEVVGSIPPGTWLDGEAIFGAGKGPTNNDWGAVQSVLGSSTNLHPSHDKILFVVFDLLALDGVDLRAQPLSMRRELLLDAIDDLSHVVVAKQMPATIKNHNRLVAKGFEGTVIKSMSSRYVCGARGHGWYKLKANKTEDVIVLGFKPGENSFAGMVGAVEFGQVRDGQIVPRGTCSGMTMEIRQDMTRHPERWIATTIEIRHNGVMPDGAFRHPQYVRPRPDKAPEDCVWS